MKNLLLIILTILTSLSSYGQIELIKNGGFTTLNSFWVTSGDCKYNHLWSTYNFDKGYAFNSEVNHALGTMTSGSMSLPSNTKSASLSFYYRISTNETDNSTVYDKLTVKIEDVNSSSKSTLVTLSNRDYNSSYQKKTITIPSSFHGKTVKLTFNWDLDGLKTSVLRVDNVSMVYSANSSSSKPDITTWNNALSVNEAFPGDDIKLSCDHGLRTGKATKYLKPYLGYYISAKSTLDNTATLLYASEYSTIDQDDEYDSESQTIKIPSGLSPGQYYILFVADYKNDISESNESNNTTVLSLLVKSKVAGEGFLTVNIDPSGARNEGAQWRANSGQWLNSGATLVLPVGNHALEYKSITGWKTPNGKTVTINGGTTTNAYGEYVENRNAPTVTILSPSGYACYPGGSIVNIEADITGDVTSKMIEVTMDGSDWDKIYPKTSSSSNLLKYSWLTPNIDYVSHFMVRVTAFHANGEVVEMSKELGTITPRAKTFGFNPNGVSHLFWPMENSSWDNQNRWSVSKGHGKKGHECAEHYALDYAQTSKISFFNAFPDNTSCNKWFLSPISGTVVYMFDDATPNCEDKANTGEANRVIIQSKYNSDFAFTVLHLNRINPKIKVGYEIKAGDWIGEIGNTGESFGAHAHCVLYKNINDKGLIKNGVDVSLLEGYLKFGISLNEAANSNECYTIKNRYAAEFKFDAKYGTGNGSTNIDSISEASAQVIFYPNPSKGIVSIKSTEALNDVQLFDLRGVSIKQFTSEEIMLGAFNMQELPKGVYIFRIQTSSGLFTEKVLLE